MDVPAFVVLYATAFFLGSIPWGVIISRVFYHTDVRKHGSGNIGTTNAFRTMGKAGGSAVFLLDFGKGLLSGFIAWLFFTQVCPLWGVAGYPLETFTACAFLGCIMGHIFSPWLGFKGGKGIAVAVGCMFVTFGWEVALMELCIFIALTCCTRYVSVGSLAAAAACPFFSLFKFWGNPAAVILCSIAACIVIWAHHGNIQRLRAGTESRIGSKG